MNNTLIIKVKYNSTNLSDANITVTDINNVSDVHSDVTDSDGVCTIQNIATGMYKIDVTYSNDEIIDISQTVTVKDTLTNIEINLNECGNMILVDKQCKYFLHEPYMTPNNYDLYFNHSNIPSNIILDSPQDLRKRLQRHLPLTKILHLNLESENNINENEINIHTGVRLKFPKITLVPYQFPLLDASYTSTSSVDYDFGDEFTVQTKNCCLIFGDEDGSHYIFDGNNSFFEVYDTNGELVASYYFGGYNNGEFALSNGAYDNGEFVSDSLTYNETVYSFPSKVYEFHMSNGVVDLGDNIIYDLTEHNILWNKLVKITPLNNTGNVYVHTTKTKWGEGTENQIVTLL